ncbi:uncharacterized protein PHALS_04587 [Plasmopara halstedii]|uniref:Uncharacterized protein n=1 Tax=Plasmopara halstedii TaxID=4781 RepID=A0A0P1A8T5_PLAHL|nr:uncharacterized protein PHALS_04587 [Plasmopara halstedii]CEG37135.1 hypothetical protein PHALS_04587 [Plasmopara halstedii]|eukprot:XP_024573504.1 hypothetical protein PHALS_04587 [Plasmopara halstedii]
MAKGTSWKQIIAYDKCRFIIDDTARGASFESLEGIVSAPEASSFKKSDKCHDMLA